MVEGAVCTCPCVDSIDSRDLGPAEITNAEIAREVARSRFYMGLGILAFTPVVVVVGLWDVYYVIPGPWALGLIASPFMLIWGIGSLFSATRVKHDAPATFLEWLFDKHSAMLLGSDDRSAGVLDRITVATRGNRALQVQAVTSLGEALGDRTLSFSDASTEPLSLTQSGVELHRFTKTLVARRPGSSTSTHAGTITLWAARQTGGPWRIVLHKKECLPWALSTMFLDLPEATTVQVGFRRAPRSWPEIEQICRAEPVLLLTCKEASAEVRRGFDERIAPWLGPTLARRRVIAYLAEAGSSLLRTDVGKDLKERGLPQVGVVILKEGSVRSSVEIDWTRRGGREVIEAIAPALEALSKE